MDAEAAPAGTRSTIRDEPLGARWCHVCVDMQVLFAPGSEWGLVWMPRVLPNIVRLCEHGADRTFLTRFIPAPRPGVGQGTWKRYYQRWAQMTLENVGMGSIEVAPELRRFVPPAELVDKPVYSPWLGSDLQARLKARGCDTLLITGGETDMCVLSTVLGAADYGYRTILIRDALCSASDATHDAMLAMFSTRYGQHVETATLDEAMERL